MKPEEVKKIKKSELTERDSATTQQGDRDKEAYVLKYILACRDEAKEARRDRMDQNRENYDEYHLRHDFAEKKPGQSQEVLPKVKMGVESTKEFFQQALVDIGDWWRVVKQSGKTETPIDVITSEEVYALTNYMLKKANYFNHIGNVVWYALLGSLGITKVTGKMVTKPKYVVKTKGQGASYKKYIEMVEDKTWELVFKEIRQVNYYPDPTGSKLYEIYEDFVDKYQVIEHTEGDYAIYERGSVDELQSWAAPDEDTGSDGPTREEETGQNTGERTYRPRIKLTCFYGNIVDEETGKLMYENVYVTIANDEKIIQKPTPNPYWHQGCDIIAAPLMSVPGSVWHTALMDSPTKLNGALTELFNLMLDAGMSTVHGIKQIRMDWVEDASQVADGIPFGTAIKTNSTMPPGGKVMEDLIVGQFPQQLFNVANIVQQEYNASALTSDLRGGITPMRQQSATAVVEQGNTITSVFNGIAKNVEVNFVQPELTLAWQTIAQNWDLIDKEVFISLFGPERGEALSQLDPEDVFASTVNGMKFEVFGITLTMNQKMEFQKYMTFLQAVAASPLFQEPFLEEFDPKKLLGELAGTIGIDKKKVRADQKPAAPPQAAQAPGGTPAAPDEMSQVPQPGMSGMMMGTQQQAGGPQPAEGQM